MIKHSRFKKYKKKLIINIFVIKYVKFNYKNMNEVKKILK